MKEKAPTPEAHSESIATLEATLEQNIQEAHAFYELLTDREGTTVTSSADLQALDSYALALQERLAQLPPAIRAAEELPPYHPHEAYLVPPSTANDNHAPLAAAG